LSAAAGISPGFSTGPVTQSLKRENRNWRVRPVTLARNNLAYSLERKQRAGAKLE